MTHAERIREAERALIEAAKVVASTDMDGPALPVFMADEALVVAVRALLALEAATCPTCGGTGDGERSRYAGCPGIVTPDCPAGCDAGKRREP